MKKITNKKTDSGYQLSAGRQSKKIVVDVTRTASRWTMQLPTGERVDRKTISELKDVFSKYVEANYGKKPEDLQRVTDAQTHEVMTRRVTRPVPAKRVRRSDRRRQCPSTECSNPRFHAMNTCLSCHYANAVKAA